MQLRRYAFVLLATLALGACDWPQLGWSGARNFSSPDTSISAANVSGLHLTWQTPADMGEPTSDAPTAAEGLLWVPRATGRIDAYDARGMTNCGGTPRTCTPLRSYIVGGLAHMSTPAVSGDGLFSTGLANVNGTISTVVYAFDARGARDSSGTPTICLPLWVGPGTGINPSPVAVVGNRAYLASDTGVSAFDTAGRGCPAGAPPVCPDATGTHGCSGTTPITCSELRRYPGAFPAVSGNLLHTSFVGAFDATGHERCGGTPVVCAPLFQSAHTPKAAVDGHDAVEAQNVVSTPFGTVLSDFDAAGMQGCSGGPPKTCTPRWTAKVSNNINACHPDPRQRRRVRRPERRRWRGPDRGVRRERHPELLGHPEDVHRVVDRAPRRRRQPCGRKRDALRLRRLGRTRVHSVAVSSRRAAGTEPGDVARRMARACGREARDNCHTPDVRFEA